MSPPHLVQPQDNSTEGLLGDEGGDPDIAESGVEEAKQVGIIPIKVPAPQIEVEGVVEEESDCGPGHDTKWKTLKSLVSYADRLELNRRKKKEQRKPKPQNPEEDDQIL